MSAIQGIDSLSQLRHGSDEITTAYLGTQLVYQNTPPAPESNWNPAQLTGLQCWLDAADGNSIYDNDSGNIAQWVDKSGNNNNFSQSLVSNQPTHDGVNTVTFDGSDRLSNATLQFDDDYVWGDTTTGHSIFVVAKSTGNGIGRLLCSPTEPRLFFGSGATDVDNNFVVAYGNNSRYNSIQPVSPTTSLSATNILGIINTQDTQTTPYVNGTSMTQIDGHMGAFTGLNIGAGTYSTVDGTWTGEVNEVVIFDRQLDLTDRNKIEGYLAYKWNLQSLLPEDHTYKALPPY